MRMFETTVIKRTVVFGAARLIVMMGLALTALAANAADKPNVILLIVDDMGWGDPPAYGFDRGVEMPNLDRMAAEGMRFTNWYAEASCTPGRAAIQTGRIPMRSALTVALGPGDKNRLRQENRTIAEFYRDNGYQTYFSGKWHLGDVEESMPINNGYETMEHFLAYYAGIYAYRNADLHPSFPRDNPKFMAAYNKMVNDGEWRAGPGVKLTRVVEHFGYDGLGTIDGQQTETAIAYLKAHSKDKKPIFMNVNFMKFHQPNHPSKEFAGKSKQGIYYDSLMEIDSYIGRIMGTIRDLGMDKNTIVLFTTDNGPWVDAAPDAGYTPFRGAKGTPYEGGWRAPAFLWAPGRLESGSVEHAMISHQDIWPTTAGLAGLTPPPHGAWKDENGVPIYFDGIDQSDYLTRKTDKEPRQVFPYLLSTRLGALRVNDWKFHFTLDDAWLGVTLNIGGIPAVYNMKMDPGEMYERMMGGAAPTTANGALQLSPGRWLGSDTAWTVGLATVTLDKLNETFKKYPNIPLIPGGATIGAAVPSFVPHTVLEGKWPPADNLPPGLKEIPTDK
jgi:arylsulfatase A-like enzyme